MFRARQQKKNFEYSSRVTFEPAALPEEPGQSSPHPPIRMFHPCLLKIAERMDDAPHQLRIVRIAASVEPQKNTRSDAKTLIGAPNPL
jgi:hypothetical protein